MSLDDIFELEEPRPRRFWAVIAVVVPVGILAGVAAWFIRAYVVPPVMTISSDPMDAGLIAFASKSRPKPPPPATRSIETTGAASADRGIDPCGAAVRDRDTRVRADAAPG